MKRLRSTILIPFAVSTFFLAGCSTQEAVKTTGETVSTGSIPFVPAPPVHQRVDPTTIKAGMFDTGKMWTFDFPPSDYFAKTYSFNPSKDWFDKARLASLRLPGCTASFVSEDGLVMTNHHCARGALDLISKEGEKFGELGFYAPTLTDERKIPNYYIDQLVLIEDVTDEVAKAFDSGADDDARVKARNAKMTEIQQRYAKKFRESTKDSMLFQLVTFYNGGKYSLYGYKRYTDIRMVYAPEEVTAFWGGDWDNFTYPRYDLDCSFYRVYDADGKPIKTESFFRFSKDGAAEGEAVFVIGNPGSTARLLTIAQLEFNRDVQFPFTIDLLNKAFNVYHRHIEKNPGQKLKYQNQLFGIGNSLKAYTGYLDGLLDPVLFGRKQDFEKKFRATIAAKPDLQAQYGSVWSDIEGFETQRSELFGPYQAYTFVGAGRSQSVSTAAALVDYAMEMKKPADQRGPKFSGSTLELTKSRLTAVSNPTELEVSILAIQLQLMEKHFAGKNIALEALLNGRSPAAAAADLVANSVLMKKDVVMSLVAGNPDEILNSTDPFIAFIVKSYEDAKKVRDGWNDMMQKRSAKVQQLGKAMYEAYGTTIPPDATFTLRIADGTIKGYEYNGTIAPPFTTFYGLYDRYYSFGKRSPFVVTDRWVSPPKEFNLATRFNQVSTNDIIGGNSGSAMVNKDLEVVGLIFDGNMESLPGNVIFEETKNRSVSVHSVGMVEALKYIYKADRLVDELKTGKMK